MSESSTLFPRLFKFLAELFKRIKSESLIVLVGVAVVVVSAIMILPADMSIERYVTAIGALILILGVVLYVLLKLANDRRDFERRIAKQKQKTGRIRLDLEQRIAKEDEEAKRIMEKCASETATSIINFGVYLLGLDSPADKRRTVLEDLTEYLEFLSEESRQRQQDKISAWFEAIAEIPKKELKGVGVLDLVRQRRAD